MYHSIFFKHRGSQGGGELGGHRFENEGYTERGAVAAVLLDLDVEIQEMSPPYINN